MQIFRMRPIPTAVGMGDTGPYFWVSGCEMDEATAKEVLKRQHTAFTADSKVPIIIFCRFFSR
jgi:hypothetical protein